MAGLEKEETTKALDVLQAVFMRFGSTRGLNQTLLLCALAYLAWMDKPNAWAYAAEMELTSMLTLYSLHRRPHASAEVKP